MEPKEINEEYHRRMEFGDWVAVDQSVDIGDLTWGAATIQWVAVSPVQPATAEWVAGLILDAAKVAVRWTKERAGKPMQHVARL